MSRRILVLILMLVLDTNLIRDAAGSDMYAGVKKAVNDAASKLRSVNSKTRLSISVQAEHAWGRLTGGSFSGIDLDYHDFPFIEELNISSSPYLGYDTPASIPADHFQRILAGRKIPVFITEGGWTSGSLTMAGGVVLNSNPSLQAA